MKTVLPIAAAALLAAIPASAQDVMFFRAGPDGADTQVFEHRVEILGAEPLDLAETVTDAPYSAQIVTEVVQQLADGNRIERRTTSSVARDGRGRVRREQPVTAIGPIVPQGDTRLVTLIDPVAKAHYMIDDARRVATKMPMPLVHRIQGRGDTKSAPADAPGGAGVRIEAGTRIERQVRVTGGPLAAAPVAGLPPDAIAFTAALRGEANVEKLGTKQIEGITVEGTKTTMTIPAGQIGNQAPIEVVSERWYSPELKTVVYSKRSDPRFGETTYRLDAIVRAEPSPELFRVPPDYKIEAARPFMRALPAAPAR